MKSRVSGGVIAAAVIACAAGMATAQTAAIGPRPTQFPDVIVSGVGASTTDIFYSGTTGGISAYSFGSVSCNIATNASWQAIWIDGGASFANQHPVIGGQMYRLFDNRFEQLGYNWLKHGFCAADASNCLSLAEPGTTVPLAPHGSCDWLGTGSTDTYTASLNSTQTGAGPRSEINPWNAQYPYPYVLQAGVSGTCINKRLQVRKADLDPAQYPGAQYIGEVVYIATDEWEPQRHNNYSYRNLAIGALTTATNGSNVCTAESGYRVTFTGNTIAKKAAIEAWKAADPTVKLVYVDAPNDGRFAIASKVIDRGNGTWRYEYAVMNLNSARGAGSFSVAKASGMMVTQQSFNAPQPHSGELYAASPWTMSATGEEIQWATQTFAANPNANMLRWATLFNYRFVTDQPPTTGSATLGFFKPAVVPGDADSITVSGIDVPSIPVPPACPADFNNVGGVTVQDIFDFLAAWFSNAPGSDFNGVGGTTVQDIFDFLAAWFTGCP